ncbi:MAG: nucleotide exchange factor GrpE [Myxococcota bacterium]
MDDGEDVSEPQADPAATERVTDDEQRPAGEATTDEPATPEQRLAELEQERDKLKDQLLRTAADYENFRRRAKRDREEAERRAREEPLRELLPVVDNLERAVQAADQADNAQAVAEGVRMVLKMFEDVAARIGLQRISALGERFDPNLHDAMQQVETDEHPPGTVVQELVPGYRLADRLLRPAMVVVARPPSGSNGASDGAGTSGSDDD